MAAAFLVQDSRYSVYLLPVFFFNFFLYPPHTETPVGKFSQFAIRAGGGGSGLHPPAESSNSSTVLRPVSP